MLVGGASDASGVSPACSSFQPVESSTSPPATLTIGIEMPKKARRCEPPSIAATSSRKAFLATTQASCWRAAAGRSAECARKIGALPKGLTIGSSAATVTRIASSPCMRPWLG